jgi:uncharacterized cupin superfamily protein
MRQRLRTPTIVPAGEPSKEISEFVGKASTGDDGLSVARMRTAERWVEPGQTAQFDEVTYVIAGEVHVEHTGGVERISAGEAIVVRAGEWGALLHARCGRVPRSLCAGVRSLARRARPSLTQSVRP